MILLVCHGETEANRAGLALGHADPPLTERGVVQARAVATALRSSGATRVVSSPLRRARSTGEAIADALDLPLEIDERLVEMDYGEWDVRSFSDFPPEDLARWRRDASFAPPGGESLLAVGDRVAALCRELVDGPTVVAVSHVSPIKAAVLWAMDADPLLAWRMRLDLASISRVGAPTGAPALLGFNDTAHLTG
ncbi:MAG: histidine phosphatase family protein [Acidimicrobiia bacterium]